MAKPIPEREPLADSFTGVVTEVNSTQLLALQAVEGTQTTHTGIFTIRYGLRFLGKPHLSIVPGLVALDYGEMLVGDAAWDFITRRSNLYPRAEVFGYRSDGRDEMMYVKNLDLALPVEVLVYADASTTTPIARPAARIAPSEADALLAPRLLQYLPRYDTIVAWQLKELP
jgi:hypothetical protein